MKKDMICISCPMGCRISAEWDNDSDITVTGNKCQRGVVYGQEEILSPRRVVTATVDINSSFLNTLWKGGMLIPRDDRTKAFFVKVDEENNPQSEIDAGRVNIEIGANPSKPAEFVIFKIGLWDGGRALEEII